MLVLGSQEFLVLSSDLLHISKKNLGEARRVKPATLEVDGEVTAPSLLAPDQGGLPGTYRSMLLLVDGGAHSARLLMERVFGLVQEYHAVCAVGGAAVTPGRPRA